MDIKKHWPLILVVIIVAALIYYFGFSGSTDNTEKSKTDEDLSNEETLGQNAGTKMDFKLEVEKENPAQVYVYAQGNGNSFATIFNRPSVEMNWDSNGKYTEILNVTSADEDFRLVILDYQYFAYGQIDDHTTHFLLFNTKNYNGKNGAFTVTEPTEYNIAQSVKALSMNWLTSKINTNK